VRIGLQRQRLAPQLEALVLGAALVTRNPSRRGEAPAVPEIERPRRHRWRERLSVVALHEQHAAEALRRLDEECTAELDVNASVDRGGRRARRVHQVRLQRQLGGGG